MTNTTNDPFGVKPAPHTGRATPDYTDPALPERESSAMERFATIWIEHEAQMAAMRASRAPHQQHRAPRHASGGPDRCSRPPHRSGWTGRRASVR